MLNNWKRIIINKICVKKTVDFPSRTQIIPINEIRAAKNKKEYGGLTNVG